jgi:hypothetical protein
MSVLLSSTLANPSTSYYALAGSGGAGGVSDLTAGPNVVLTPPTGIGSVQVSLSNVLTTSSTAPTTIATTWGAVGSYPTTSVAGLYTGSSFTPQNTGTHLIEVRCGFNVDAATTKAVINTTGEEFITIGLVNTTTNVLVSAINVFPVPMSAAGNDYGLSTSFVAPLVSTATYQLTRFATSAGGVAFSLGADNSAVQIAIIPLC